MTRWTADDIPDLAGRRALVTGASSGLGLVTAAELARHGADVLVAVRDRAKGESALAHIESVAAGRGSASLLDLDLADLGSVRAAAEQVSASPLHLLVNNAGVMAIPRRETADGFEMQLGTNHLGHMALTLLLLPALAAGGEARTPSRVVTVSSGAHRMGRIDIDDLMGERTYSPWKAYGQSKLANLLFAFELQHRLDTSGLPVASYAAHPGYAATNLQAVGPQMEGSSWKARMMEVANRVLAQSAEMGALPTLYAATVPGIPAGSYIGPDGAFEQRGYPRLVGTAPSARDLVMGERLWAASEGLVGVRFDDVVVSIAR